MPRGRPCKCPYDGSTNTVSKGVRVTKTLGIRKIRRCKTCGRKFTPKNQKLVPVEDDQADEAQMESANEGPSEELTSIDTVDSAPAESLSDDLQETEMLDPEEPADGY